MTPVGRWAVLAGVVALVVYLAPEEPASIVQPAVRQVSATPPQRQAPQMQPKSAARTRATERQRDEASPAELFAMAEWMAPKPVPQPNQVAPAPVAQVPAPSQAPPLPFKVLGRVREAAGAAVFLQFNDQNLVARTGDVLVDQYRVEQMDEVSMTLTHVPTGLRQTLALAGAQ